MAENDDLDFFPTPWGLVYAALRDYHAEVYRPKAILDAGAGDGRWGKVARELWPNTRIDAIDIVRHPGFDPSPYDNVYTADFLTWEPQSEYGEMIGNPPYNKWEAFLECGLALPGVKDVYMLLRLGVLAGINRVQKFYPPPPPCADDRGGDQSAPGVCGQDQRPTNRLRDVSLEHVLEREAMDRVISHLESKTRRWRQIMPSSYSLENAFMAGARRMREAVTRGDTTRANYKTYTLGAAHAMDVSPMGDLSYGLQYLIRQVRPNSRFQSVHVIAAWVHRGSTDMIQTVAELEKLVMEYLAYVEAVEPPLIVKP